MGFDVDIVKIGVELRAYASPGFHISQLTAPYRKLLNKLNGTPHENRKESLRKLLMEVISDSISDDRFNVILNLYL